MRLLLDTHVVLWWLDKPSQISATAHQAIRHSENSVLLSSAVIWEISIKVALGNLRIPEDFMETLRLAGFQDLPVTHKHAWTVSKLPHHHRDPFDRILIAQAQFENLTLVSRDRLMRRYEIQLIEA